MGKLLLILLIILLSAAGVFYLLQHSLSTLIINPIGKEKVIVEKPLEKYSFERLKKAGFLGNTIEIGKVIKEEEEFTSRMFYFYDPSAGSGQAKKVSGLMNLPTKAGSAPAVIVMLRGYVDRDKFTSGEGTRRSGEEFARNGFITLAPDFLGFGESAKSSDTSIEDRFQTYTTALSLLTSLPTLNKAFEKEFLDYKADSEKVGIWGHSNGGHIALAVLAITGKSYPTVLWAPVSKPFPYSILYFTDEFDDHGKALRKVVSDFEKDYDIEKYSVNNYYAWIKAPVSLHQGINDEEVPVRWSEQLKTDLEKEKIDVSYFTYPGENHNFNQGGWSIAMQRSVEFYKQHFLADTK